MTIHRTNDGAGHAFGFGGHLVSPGAFLHHPPAVAIAPADPAASDRAFLDRYPTTRAALKALMATQSAEEFVALTGIDPASIHHELMAERRSAEGLDDDDRLQSPHGLVPLTGDVDGYVVGTSNQPPMSPEEQARFESAAAQNMASLEAMRAKYPDGVPPEVAAAATSVPIDGPGGQVVPGATVTDQPLAGTGQAVQLGAGDPPASPIVPADQATAPAGYVIKETETEGVFAVVPVTEADLDVMPPEVKVYDTAELAQAALDALPPSDPNHAATGTAPAGQDGPPPAEQNPPAAAGTSPDTAPKVDASAAPAAGKKTTRK